VQTHISYPVKMNVDVATGPTAAAEAPVQTKKAARTRVVVDVGGTTFKVLIATLAESSSYFCDFFNRWNEDEEHIYLDRDPAPFEILLTYMRSGLISIPATDKSMWQRVICEADYLGMVGMLNAIKVQTYRNSVTPSWKGTDAEAVIAFDEAHGSLEKALCSDVLPGRFFHRMTGITSGVANPQWKPRVWQPDDPCVLKLLPADGHRVRFEAKTPRRDPMLSLSDSGIVRDVLALALVKWPGDAGPVLDAFVTNDTDGGGILASKAYPGRKFKWTLFRAPTSRIVQLSEDDALTPEYWTDKDDHSKGTFEGGAITMLRVFDGNAEQNDTCFLRPPDGNMVEPLEEMHVCRDSDDSDDDDIDVTDADERNRRRERRKGREERRRGKLILHNIMKHNNFKGFKGTHKHCPLI
jgi:hypothetical protein